MFLPIGALVMVAFIVTFGVHGGFEQENKINNALSSELQEIKSKMDEVAKEVEGIKKAIEE